jgi:hypothetical protein
MLMARAGSHPNFMTALYHLLEGQPQQRRAELLDSSHPLWDDRNGRLRTHIAAAAQEFGRLCPRPMLHQGAILQWSFMEMEQLSASIRKRREGPCESMKAGPKRR